jgi:hypothetical protein
MSDRIDVRIDEVVLDGFDPRDGRTIEATLQSELTRMLRAPGAPPPASREFSAGAPADVGAAAARAVAAAVHQARRSA